MRKCRPGFVLFSGFVLVCAFACSANAASRKYLAGHRSAVLHTSCTHERLHSSPDFQYESITATAYPEAATRLGHEGAPVILATLDPNGMVTHAELYQRSGYSELDAAALKAVKSRQFPPCPAKGQPRPECYVTIPVVFKLPH